VLNEKLPGWLRAFPARWVVRGENNRRGYVRRSCSVGLMDGGSIPPGSTIWVVLAFTQPRPKQLIQLSAVDCWLVVCADDLHRMELVHILRS